MHALRLIGRGSRDTVDSSTLWCLPPALCRAGGAHTAREAHHRRSSSGSGSSGRGASTGVAADAAAELQLMDAIHMRGLLFHGHHGVFPEEKKLGQKFLVDATLFCGRAGLRAAGRSDDLARSVNYADVYATVKKVMEGPPYHLLEAAAEEICGSVLRQQPAVAAVRLQVRKPHVALSGPLESVGIEILRRRAEEV